MGFGFASAGCLVGGRPWHQRNQTSPRDGLAPVSGVRPFIQRRVPTLNPLGSLVKADERVGTDTSTFNHMLLRTQFLGVGMWLRHHVAPALGPHSPTRPLTDWSTPACLQLHRLLICSPRVGQGRWPRRGDRPERSAGWERCGMGEVVQPRPISRPTPVVSPRRSPAGRANLVGPGSSRCHGNMSG